jgi:hypothetical protein
MKRRPETSLDEAKNLLSGSVDRAGPHSNHSSLNIENGQQLGPFDAEPRVGIRLYPKHLEHSSQNWGAADFVCINHPTAETVEEKGIDPHALTNQRQSLVMSGIGPNPDGRSLTDEIRLVTDVTPDLYIPDAGDVRHKDINCLSDGAVRANINHYHKVTDRLRQFLDDITLCPLIKGTRSKHYRLYNERLPEVATNRIAVYVGEYGCSPGYNIDLVKRQVRNAVTRLDPEQALVIGRGAPHELAAFPPRATAASTYAYFRRESADTQQLAGEADCRSVRQALRSKAERQATLQALAQV